MSAPRSAVILAVFRNVRRAALRLRQASLCAILSFWLMGCAGIQGGTQAGGAGPGGVSELNASQQEALADLHLRSGRTDLAASGYAAALGLRPGDASLRLKQGQALLRLNQPAPALEAFSQALALASDSAPALAGQGESLQLLGRLPEAEAALRRSVALVPLQWRTRCLLGLVLEAQGRPREAVDEYLAALAAPDSGQARIQLLNNLGLAQALAGDAEAGARTLRSVLSSGPAPERVSNNLGLLLVQLGRYDEALASFRLCGDDPRALNNMGSALLLRGEARLALALFEKALAASPQHYALAEENLMRATLALEGGNVLPGSSATRLPQSERVQPERAATGKPQVSAPLPAAPAVQR